MVVKVSSLCESRSVISFICPECILLGNHAAFHMGEGFCSFIEKVLTFCILSVCTQYYRSLTDSPRGYNRNINNSNESFPL